MDRNPATTKPRPPGPHGRYIRNTVMRIRNTLGLFQWLHRTYGDIVWYNILHLKFCVIFDPELTDEVLVQQRSSFEKGFL